MLEKRIDKVIKGILVLVTVFALGMIFSCEQVYANEAFDTIENVTGISEKEFEEIINEAIIENNLSSSSFASEVDITQTSINDADGENYFIEYRLSANPVTEYHNNPDFDSLIEHEYLIRVPCVMQDGTKAMMGFMPDEGNFKMVELAVNSGNADDFISREDLKQILENANIDEEIQQVRFVLANQYYMHLAYVKTLSNEYIVPAMVDEMTKMKPRELYTVEEFFEKMYKTYDETAVDPETNGGVMYRKSPMPLIALICIGVGVIGAATCFVLLFINKKRATVVVQN